MSIFTKAWSWLKGAFTTIEEDVAPVVVAVIEEVSTLFKSGTIGFIASLLDTVTKNQVPTQVANTIGAQLPKLIAVELAVQGLPDSPTDADIEAFEQRVLTAFGLLDDKSKLYTTVGAQLLGIVRADIAAGTKFTFAELVKDLEEAYTDYQSDLAAQEQDA